jgi:hypothetical protein
MEDLEKVQAEEENEVEWQEGEVLDESLVGQLEEESGEVQELENEVQWQEGEVLDESLVEQLEEELEEVEWEEVQEESLVEQLDEELEEFEWEDEEKEVQFEEGEDTDGSLVEQLADDLVEEEMQLEDEILTEETPGFFLVVSYYYFDVCLQLPSFIIQSSHPLFVLSSHPLTHNRA